jgi:Protein of unknown function (DUF559)
LICPQSHEIFIKPNQFSSTTEGCSICTGHNVVYAQKQFEKLVIDKGWKFGADYEYINTTTTVHLICDKNHDTYPCPSNFKYGYGCFVCVNKTETKLGKYIETLTDELSYQPKYDWCKNIKTDRHLPFDFVCEQLKLIIEVDGPQHFYQIANWTNPKETMKNDFYKMECAISNGYTVIRILQKDVWNDVNDWKENLETQLFKRDTPEVIYLYGGKEFDIHSSFKTLLIFHDD